MPAPIEDYALLSDCRTAALVSRDGSVDWLCMPRFDSPSIFGALLGDDDHGCWRLRPSDPAAVATRRYDGDTFILVTRWECAEGVAEVHDVLPIARPKGGDRRAALLRRVVGVSGSVEFSQQLRLRFDYARALPWIRRTGSRRDPHLVAIAGPDAVVYRGAPLRAADHVHEGAFAVGAGETRDLTLTWYPSHRSTPEAQRVDAMLERTRGWWGDWAARLGNAAGLVGVGSHRAAVVRSLLVLRALTDRDTGGIVAAPTTSLPEEIGGSRNWDYRYVWLRDAALALSVLISLGALEEVEHWRAWLLRAIAGDPEEMQIVYGVAGERDLFERELTSLPGYLESPPVRVGNAAADQYQADVAGEVLVALSDARDAGLADTAFSWPLERAILSRTVALFDEPDNGIWEIRGEPRMFTHSRAMVWAALDRGVRAVREHGLDGPVELWERKRDEVRAEIDAHGVDADGCFVQSYGSTDVDAALLLLPQVGFCAADDPRLVASVARMERTLMPDGLLLRYRSETGVDGVAGTDHPFLACSLWLVEQYAATGRLSDAEALLDRVCGLANDVGLISEEYDPHEARQLGNTPQALSHLSLVRAAVAVERAGERSGVERADQRATDAVSRRDGTSAAAPPTRS